jgi:hypothetical protein
MKRLWSVAAVTLLGTAGCGTMLNLTDLDDKGREPYGGVARDVQFFTESVPSGRPAGPGHIDPRALPLVAAVFLAYVGCAAAETSLSYLGDACSAPALPLLDRLAGYGVLPSLSGKPVPVATASETVAAVRPREQPGTDEPQDGLPSLHAYPAFGSVSFGTPDATDESAKKTRPSGSDNSRLSQWLFPSTERISVTPTDERSAGEALARSVIAGPSSWGTTGTANAAAGVEPPQAAELCDKVPLLDR